ncbi:putative membrane protein [Salmonella phage D5lw]|nr:putative membrane protein [Salmonella phage D5lw]
MKIKQVDSIFMMLMLVIFTVSLVGVMVTEGVQQRPFLVICPVSIATFFYLAFRVELGSKFG